MDLYNDLGVDKNSTAKQIKKAYRKKASKNHPDRGGDVEDFKTIQLAYDVLKDEVRRKDYDETGGTGKITDKISPVIGNLFAKIINDNEFNGDVIKTADNYLKKLKENISVGRIQLHSRIAQLEKQLGRVGYISEENIFENALLSKIKEMKDKIELNLKQEKENDEVILEMKNYKDLEYKKAQEKLSTLISGTGYTTVSTGGTYG